MLTKINTYIIPVLNNYQGALDLIKSLKKYTPDNYYIFIINNGYSISQPDTIHLIRELKKEVHLWIDPYRNLGFGKAMNTGIKLATTEFITLANDDVKVLYPEWWEEIMTKFKEDSRLGGFNPHSFCNKTAGGDRVCQYKIKCQYTEEDIKKMKEIFKAEREYTGCCTFFTICKKAMFDEVGLFDESFGIGSGEDYDLMVRAARKNWLIKGGSSTMIFHQWGCTKDNIPESIGISNYDLIVGGNQNMVRKWNFHCDEVQRQLKDGRLTEEQAKELNGGWSVAGKGGPEEPLDKDKINYKDKKWYQEINL